MEPTNGTLTATRTTARRLPLVVGTSKWAQLRGRADLSVRELEAESGISRGVISLIEGERRLQPTPAEAAAILGALARRGVVPEVDR